MSKHVGWGVMTSHRSGETEDKFITDLAVGLSTGQIKTGVEAMFVDLVHFIKKSIQLAFSMLICLSRIRDEPIMNLGGKRGSKILVNLMRIGQWTVICCSLRGCEMKIKSFGTTGSW